MSHGVSAFEPPTFLPSRIAPRSRPLDLQHDSGKRRFSRESAYRRGNLGKFFHLGYFVGK
jgi:hypothetical protein